MLPRCGEPPARIRISQKPNAQLHRRPKADRCKLMLDGSS
jgi:hypothetical protein